MDNSSLDKQMGEFKAFAIQLSDPLYNGRDPTREILAIMNNSPADYNFGHRAMKGLQAFTNIFAKEIGIKRIHLDVMVAYAMNLGADGLQRLYAVLGHNIDCYNMTATMLRLRDEQEDQGTGRSNGAMSQATKQKISDTQTGRTYTVSRRQAISSGLTRAFEGKKQANEQVKEARNSAFDNFTPSRNELEGKLLRIRWKRKYAVWYIKLKSSHFDSDRALYVASFTRLRDAKAAMKYLSNALKGLCARLPSNRSKFDRKERKNKRILNNAIGKVRLQYNARNNPGKADHDVNIF